MHSFTPPPLKVPAGPTARRPFAVPQNRATEGGTVRRTAYRAIPAMAGSPTRNRPMMLYSRGGCQVASSIARRRHLFATGGSGQERRVRRLGAPRRPAASGTAPVRARPAGVLCRHPGVAG